MRRLSHYVTPEVDLAAAVASGTEVTATCGARFVPVAEGPHAAAWPDCPTCHQDERPHQRRRESTYVYRCYDADARLIYVGCTSSPRTRMEAHRATSWWFSQVARTRYLVFQDREYALMKEREAIGEERPRWNIKGRWNHRSLWAPADYRDYYTALLRSKGLHTRHLKEVATEGRRRYGLDLEFEHALADTA